MPRMARQKQEGAVYHIMARSISEVQLFKYDEDKKKYMLLIKEYQDIYNFKVYAYCLMDNHIHLIIDSNGADISKIMHCINFKYARYFNNLHKRHGHLFQDRFKSKIITNDRYLIALSAYIHNNPLDIAGYEYSAESYYYSSLGIYLGLRKDDFNILDKYFILNLFGDDKNKAKEKYMNLILKTTTLTLKNVSKEEVEFENEKSEYRSERKVLIRDFNAQDIVKYVGDKFKIQNSLLYLKYKRNTVAARSVLALLLRNLCNASCKDICNILGNITSSRVSMLSNMGAKLVSSDQRYKNVISEFMECCS